MNLAKLIAWSAAASLLAGVAHGQEGPMIDRPPITNVGKCGAYNTARAGLLKDNGEFPIFRGASDDGDYVVELFSSVDEATFTILGVRADGKACVLAQGHDLTSVKKVGPPASKYPSGQL
jgi:hypothetical protein